MPYVITDRSWYAVAEDFDQSTLLPGETLVKEIPQWLIDNVEAEEALRTATLLLTSKLSQGYDQVRYIQGRITTLDWLINGQDPDDEDYEEPTAEDEAELAALKPRLNKWNSYNNKLSKVSQQATWPKDPVWPVMPDLYVFALMSAEVQ